MQLSGDKNILPEIREDKESQRENTNQSFRVLEIGHPDQHFGAQGRMGKDGCGY